MALAILENRKRAARLGRLFCVSALALTVAACGSEENAQETETPAVEAEVMTESPYEVGQIINRPSGLQIEVLVAGDGPMPGLDDEVLVDYEGRLTNGEIFDSSYSRGRASRFAVGGLIAGWTEALQLMPTGSKWRLTIPPEIAYGDRDIPRIPANSTLIFDMELIDIVNAPEFNQVVADVIAVPFANHDCGVAPSYDPDVNSRAELPVLHADGNAWQDCMNAYIKSGYENFEMRSGALSQISPNDVPNSQKIAVNEYFSSAAILVQQAEKDLEDYKGIPAK